MAKPKYLRECVRDEMKRNKKLLEHLMETGNFLVRSKMISNMERGRLALLSNRTKDLRGALKILRDNKL